MAVLELVRRRRVTVPVIGSVVLVYAVGVRLLGLLGRRDVDRRAARAMVEGVIMAQR